MELSLLQRQTVKHKIKYSVVRISVKDITETRKVDQPDLGVSGKSLVFMRTILILSALL